MPLGRTDRDVVAVTEDARRVALQLLAARAPQATVCPSEVAKALAAVHPETEAMAWRDAMPMVHAAVDRMLDDGLVRLSWKGRMLTVRAGPYRIGRSG